MRRRRSRRRLRALSSRSCSPFERKKRRFLRSLRIPERCICVWNRFNSCSGSSPSRSVTKDKLPTLLELRRPTTEPAIHRRKPIIAAKPRSCHWGRALLASWFTLEPGWQAAHEVPGTEWMIRIGPGYGTLKKGIPSPRASGRIVMSSLSTPPPSRAVVTTLPLPNTQNRFGVCADHSVMAFAVGGADRKGTLALSGTARTVALVRTSVGRSPHNHPHSSSC